MRCLYCDAVLSLDNESLAHVFPEALGGRLASHGICCATCNNSFSALESVAALRLAIPSAMVSARKGDGTLIAGIFEHEGSRYRVEGGEMHEEAPPPRERGRVWPLPARADRQIGLVAAALRQRRLPPEAILDQRFIIEDAEPDPQSSRLDPFAGVPLSMLWGDFDTARVMAKSACELLAYARPESARLPALESARAFAREGRGGIQVTVDTSTVGSEFSMVESPYVHGLDVWTRREAVYLRFTLFSELRFVAILTAAWAGPPTRVGYSFDCRNPSTMSFAADDTDGDAVVRKSYRLWRRELEEASARLSETMRLNTPAPRAFRAVALTAQELYEGVRAHYEDRPWPTV